MISYAEAKYLKHMGSLIDVKVSIRHTEYGTKIYIRDQELSTVRGALCLLQRITEEEIVVIKTDTILF